jgi:flagellar basal-body rod modification protein FlgD
VSVTAISAPITPDPALRPKTESRGKGIASDFNTFLRMLTTQLQNQDPTSPMESAEFAVQLATFSGVEQQMKTNQLLEGLGGQIGVMGMAELAGWVGKQAKAPAPAWFSGAPLSVTTTPDSLADAAVLVVRDAAGKAVRREGIALTPTTFDWAGTSDSGGPLPTGKYSFEVESSAKGAVIKTAPAETYATIIEARGGASGTTLVLEGGIEVPAGQVTALRNH